MTADDAGRRAHTPPLPRLEVHLERIAANARALTALAARQGVRVTGVVKGVDGSPAIAATLLTAGCVGVADSRVEALAGLRAAGIEAPTTLLRVPMLSQAREVVRHADTSFTSEVTVLAALDAAARAAGRVHRVVLMVDLGDLREGFIDEAELLAAADTVERDLSGLHLAGVATNLGCYGSIVPTPTNLSRLVGHARAVEARIGRPLEVIGGGRTTTLPLLTRGTLPAGITDLWVGEAILLGHDLPALWDTHIPGTTNETMTLRCEVIECRRKPSHPVGEVYVDAFGRRPTFTDLGPRIRALLACGRKDIGDPSALIPRRPGVTVVGASSDHLICDVTDATPPVVTGDTLDFSFSYETMMYGSALLPTILLE